MEGTDGNNLSQQGRAPAQTEWAKAVTIPAEARHADMLDHAIRAGFEARVIPEVVRAIGAGEQQRAVAWAAARRAVIGHLIETYLADDAIYPMTYGCTRRTGRPASLASQIRRPMMSSP